MKRHYYNYFRSKGKEITTENICWKERNGNWAPRVNLELKELYNEYGITKVVNAQEEEDDEEEGEVAGGEEEEEQEEEGKA